MGNLCAGAPDKSVDTGAQSPRDIQENKAKGPPTPRAAMDDPKPVQKDEHEESNKKEDLLKAKD